MNYGGKFTKLTRTNKYLVPRILKLGYKLESFSRFVYKKQWLCITYKKFLLCLITSENYWVKY